jgi:choline kinase
MEIIVPAAGASSRFPDMKPKYLLYDYGHKMMIQRALEPYKGHNITIGILKDHDAHHSASDYLRHEFDTSTKIVIMDKLTKGPADTVYQIIKNSIDIDLDAELFIKDCDSFFDHEMSEGNYICVSNIAQHDVLKKLSSKSFVIANEQGIITDIIEKNVVSDTFCVGGYKFASARIFCEAFEELKLHTEIFVSDVIQRCLHKGEIFTEKLVSNYVDVGTAQDWFEYNDKPVIFCDIDGTLIESQGRVGGKSFNSPIVPMQKTVDRLLEYQKNGAQFIFTTARPKDVERVTYSLLVTLGFRNFELIMGLQNSRRILINDFNNANPYPRATAINVERDKDQVANYL